MRLPIPIATALLLLLAAAVDPADAVDDVELGRRSAVEVERLHETETTVTGRSRQEGREDLGVDRPRARAAEHDAAGCVDPDERARGGLALEPVLFEGGGAWMAPGATFDGSDCEMGSGTTDNLIHDVAWDDLGTWGASWNGPATFACTDGGCE